MLLVTPEGVDGAIKIIYGMITITMLIFGWDLLLRYFKADKQTRGDAAYLVFFVMGLAMVGYACYMVTRLFELINVSGDWTNPLLQFIVMIILGALASTTESIILKKRRLVKIGKFNVGLVALISVILIIFTGVLFMKNIIDTDASWDRPAYYVVWASWVFFGFLSFFGIVNILFVRLAPQKEIKKKMVFGLLGGIISFIGAGVQIVYRPSMSIGYIYGAFMELFGWLLMRYFFLSVPSYSELEWKSGLREIHVIMAETGLSIFYRRFHAISADELKGDWTVQMKVPEQNRPDTDLVGGGMIGIKGMLSEIAGTKGKLESIQIGEKHLIFKQGESVLILLLADNHLGVYHNILNNLVVEIEQAFPVLKDFKGDTSTLKIAPIVDKYFGADVNPQTKKAPAPKKEA